MCWVTNQQSTIKAKPVVQLCAYRSTSSSWSKLVQVVPELIDMDLSPAICSFQFPVSSSRFASCRLQFTICVVCGFAALRFIACLILYKVTVANIPFPSFPQCSISEVRESKAVIIMCLLLHFWEREASRMNLETFWRPGRPMKGRSGAGMRNGMRVWNERFP